MRLALVLAILFLSGCVDTDHLLLTPSPPARITPHAPVQVLDAAPTRPFIKLAMVEAKETGPGYATWEELRQALMKQAEQLNADAVMELTTGNEASTGGLVGTSYAGFIAMPTGSIKQLRALALRYTTLDVTGH
ncbi:MAG TPA: hypothetical protein VGQ08_00085 [Nitrospiraceae bacterium]|jgi:hypothetical protein|nr:hypothetical protein [Nitrospiraceae bacterium]